MDGDGTPALGLVIFDCDGVLVDSEPLSLACLTDGLNRIGVDIDVETVRARFAGTAMPSIMAHVARNYGVDAPDGFVATVKAETLRAFDEVLEAMPGVAAAVAAQAARLAEARIANMRMVESPGLRICCLLLPALRRRN